MSSTDSNEVKRPAWRPSEYKPEYCETVIEHGRLGKSKEQMAVACNVSKSETLDRWANEHPEFSEALSYAGLLSLDYWENVYQENRIDSDGTRLNSVYPKIMAARFPKKYREQTAVTMDAKVETTVVEAAFASRPDVD